jgi:hypothetical protein
MTEQDWQIETSKKEVLPVVGKRNLIFSGTDGYGLCLSVALETHLKNHGKKAEISFGFPENSPRFFWTGKNPTILSKPKLAQMDTTFVVGIPFNNWSDNTLEQSIKTSNEVLQRLKQDKNDKTKQLILINQRHSREDLPPLSLPPGVRDLTKSLETLLEKDENQQEDGINLVHLARFIIKDRSVLEKVQNTQKVNLYQKLALGTEIASRASLAWYRKNQDLPNFYKAHAEESTRRAREAIKKLKERNWQFFIKEAQEFRHNFLLPTVTISPSPKDLSPSIAFSEIGDLPIGFHFLALEEIVQKTNAKTVIAIRYNPLKPTGAAEKSPYKLKVVRNIKDKSPDFVGEIKKFLNEGDKIVGTDRFTTVQTINAKRLVELTRKILLFLDPNLNQVFEGTRGIAVMGNPNTGKSVVAEIIERYCNNLSGRQVAKRIEEVDKTGFTPDFFLEAFANLREIEKGLERGESPENLYEEMISAEREFKKAEARRNQLKIRKWTDQALRETKELIDSLPKNQISLIDFPGGKPTKNKKGEIIKVNRDVPEITLFLMSPKIHGVLILGQNKKEIDKWHSLIKKINKQRIKKGLLPLKSLGDLITSPEPKPLVKADYPKQLLPKNIVGELGGVKRGNIYEPNSHLLMLSILIVSLGLQESRQNL